jgi:hypothetical protein
VTVAVEASAGAEAFDRVRLRNGVIEPLEEVATRVEVALE